MMYPRSAVDEAVDDGGDFDVVYRSNDLRDRILRSRGYNI